MDSKKISFGFSKFTKKNALIPSKATKQVENQKELIKCFEGQQIKLVEERKEVAALIIPVKDGGKTSAALASLMKRRAVLLGEDEEEPQIIEKTINLGDELPKINESIEERAKREILAELQSKTEEINKSLVLPVVKADELPLEGAKESTLMDYDAIPIEQYGLAMLRGMGWKEPPAKKQKGVIDDAPMVRPKGMGLGADKALKPKPLLIAPEANEVLEIKKQAFVRILGGKFKEAYGQIEGFDDDKGRVIVKLAIGGTKEAFNEFLCQPVSKKEYAQYGKCINTAKYEEYKKMENEHGQIILKKDEDRIKKVEYKNIKTENSSKYSSESSKIVVDDSRRSDRSKYNDFDTSRSHRARSRTRSRSPPRKNISSSSNRHYEDSLSKNKSDTDSPYERRSRHSDSKSNKKSKSSKKKHRDYNSSDNSSPRKTHVHDSTHSDDSSDEQHERRHKSHRKKKSKKTKKSKRQRSRTPVKRRK